MEVYFSFAMTLISEKHFFNEAKSVFSPRTNPIS